MKKNLKQYRKSQARNKDKKNINYKRKLRKKLSRYLVKHLGWKKSIANFGAAITCAILSINGVWQKKIAQATDEKAYSKSIERRLQRFLSSFLMNYHMISLMIFRLMGFKEKVIIILDRTNWRYGKKNINIFVAAALFQQPGCLQSSAVPLVWEVFDKKGNSHTKERKQLMNRLLAITGHKTIEVVLADREFIGTEWLQFLNDLQIPFTIRTKKNGYVYHEGKRKQIVGLVAHAKRNKTLRFEVQVDGIDVWLFATRSTDEDLVIVFASKNITSNPLEQYKLRWMIELFFKSIKRRGFNIEETHMTDPFRIKALFAFIALATVCTVQAGAIRNHVKKIRIKKNGRPEFSIFTYGLDFIRDLFRGVHPALFFQPHKHAYNFLPGPVQSLFALEKG